VSYAPSFPEDAQTLVLDNVGHDADLSAIPAHEAYVFEIRLIGQTRADTGITPSPAPPSR